jgi:hypothetical protein
MTQYKKCKQSTQLIFDVPKPERLGQIHNLSVEVKVNTGVKDEADVTTIGLDRRWPADGFPCIQNQYEGVRGHGHKSGQQDYHRN